MSTLQKPEIYNFKIEDKYFCIIPPTGDVFEIDEISYDFCDLIRKHGWETGKQKFVDKYSEEIWDSKIKEIKSDAFLNKIFFHSYGDGSKGKIQFSIDTLNLKTSQKISSIALNVAETCNFNCVYCFADGGTYHTSVSMMDSKVGKQAIDMLMNIGPEKVTIGFFGGEPLLNFRLIQELVQYAEQKAKETGKRVGFSITTNGYLVTDYVIDYFLAHNFSVVVSIDGPKEIHDHNRKLKNGLGTFDIVSRNAKKMIERGVNVVARATLLPSQIGEFYKVYKALRDLGFRSVGVEIATTNIEEKPGDKELQLLKKALKRIAKLELKEFKDRGIIYRKFDLHISDLYSGKHLNYPCGMGRTYVSISADGSIYPCHRFVGMPNFKLGGVWNFDPDQEFIQTVREATVDKRAYCKTCWSRRYCGGGCSYENYYYNGDIFKPYEFNCKFIQENIKWAIWLYSKILEKDKNWLHQVYGKSHNSHPTLGEKTKRG